MSLRLSVLLLCLLALSVDSKRKHNRDLEPEFIKNLTSTQRGTFFEVIKNNENLTIQEADDKLVEWAKKYKLTEQYAEFEKQTDLRKEELSKNVTAVIERLAAAKIEVDKILADKSLTKKQQQEKKEELKKTYPHEVDTLFFIGNHLSHHSRGSKHARKEDGSEGRKGHHKKN